MSHFLSLFLVLSLVLGAGLFGYKKTAHALLQAGLTEIEICSTEGAAGVATVVLDRNGNEIAPGSHRECTHCADCSLVPHFVLPSFAVALRAAENKSPVFSALVFVQPRSERVWHPSRDPPMQRKV
ncbi:MAG: DUF2946 family protein [Pseudoruegeria sp.]